jgi:hypothetical protein
VGANFPIIYKFIMTKNPHFAKTPNLTLSKLAKKRQFFLHSQIFLLLINKIKFLAISSHFLSFPFLFIFS